MLRKAFVACLIALSGQTHAGQINFSGTFERLSSAILRLLPYRAVSVSCSMTLPSRVACPRSSSRELVSLSLSPNLLGGTAFDTSNTARGWATPMDR
jgi:hypothetical protein